MCSCSRASVHTCSAPTSSHPGDPRNTACPHESVVATGRAARSLLNSSAAEGDGSGSGSGIISRTPSTGIHKTDSQADSHGSNTSGGAGMHAIVGDSEVQHRPSSVAEARDVTAGGEGGRKRITAAEIKRKMMAGKGVDSGSGKFYARCRSIWCSQRMVQYDVSFTSRVIQIVLALDYHFPTSSATCYTTRHLTASESTKFAGQRKHDAKGCMHIVANT
jgi:hypothetical protein